jgi:hypothetical protein
MTRQHIKVSLFASLLAAPAIAIAQQGPQAPVRYEVHRGDTCVSIAQHFYRDARQTALIHSANPTMGRPPHHLRAGTVLVIPPRQASGVTPDALLTTVHNTVEVRAPLAGARTPTTSVEGPAARRGRPNDPLFRGTRVNTQERSSAEVTFADETQLQLAERTLIVILGETSARVQRDASARDTVLERGALTAFLAGLDGPRAAPSPAVATDAGRVSFAPGTEARLEVDEGRRSTLAVFRGRSEVSAHRQRVPVPQGYGVRAVRGQRIPAPRLLPLAPVWGARPPRLVLSDADTTTLVSELRPGDASTVRGPHGEAPPAPAQWHVEVARDRRFNELVADTRGPAEQTRLAVPDVAQGAYFIRVSAIDGDAFQGPPSEVVSATVTRLAVEPAASDGGSRVTVAPGFYCGLDGAPLAPTTAEPIAFDRRVAHTLRCALDAAGEGAVERAFEAAPAPVTPVIEAPVTPVVVAPAVVAPPAPPPDRWHHRVAVHLEGGAVYMLSEYQRNSDRAAPGYEGNALALSWGGGGGGRVGVQLVHPDGSSRGLALAVEAGGAYVRLPAGAGSTLGASNAAFTLVGAGLRLEPFAGRWRFYIDAHAGVAVTGGLARFGFDAGLGLDAPLAAWASAGPFVRYLHVVEGGDLPIHEDARLLSAGVAVTLRPASARW